MMNIISFHQTSVEVLSIAHNKLERVRARVFAELINLFRLSLSDNKISSIDDDALGGLHQVRYLDLSRNRLTRHTKPSKTYLVVLPRSWKGRGRVSQKNPCSANMTDI